MSKLHYIKEVWDNLEESYNKYSKKVAISRTDYLKELVAYNNNSNGSTILENYLSDEVESYNETEFELYDSLRQLFNEVYDKLQTLGNKVISKFSEIFEATVTTVDVKDFTGFTKRVYQSPDYMLKKGMLLSTVVYEDGKARSYTTQDTEDFITINSVHQLTNFLYDESINSSEFKKTAYVAITTLAQNGKLTTPIVVMSNKYYELRGKSFVAGKIRHSYSRVNLGKTKFTTLGGIDCEALGNFVLFRVNLGKKICTVIGVETCQ